MMETVVFFVLAALFVSLLQRFVNSSSWDGPFCGEASQAIGERHTNDEFTPRETLRITARTFFVGVVFTLRLCRGRLFVL